VKSASDECRPWTAYANDPLENASGPQLIRQLREYLQQRLPEYMIPSAWMLLKELPLTANGKLDSRALPNPQLRPEEMGEYIAARTDLERELAELWAALLQVDQVGIRDNFFELGGHSMHSIRLIAGIAERFGARLPVLAVFQHPTVEQMAAAIESLRPSASHTLEAAVSEFEEGVL
jgi:acyl carrier protein